MAEQNEEGKKTIVSFIVGLLIGGLLVWTFSGTGESTTTDTDRTATSTDTSVVVDDTEDDSADSADTADTNKADVTTNPPEVTITPLPTGDGAVTIADTNASSRIPMESATFPVSEGWVGVRDYNNGQLGPILGVVRFSEEQGLVPTEIILQRSTVAGNEYAIVFYTEDGDRDFNLASDVQIEGVVTTFTAS